MKISQKIEILEKILSYDVLTQEEKSLLMEIINSFKKKQENNKNNYESSKMNTISSEGGYNIFDFGVLLDKLDKKG